MQLKKMKRNFSAIRRGRRSSLLRSQLSVARYILGCRRMLLASSTKPWNVQPSSMKSFLDPNGSPAKVKEPWCKKAMTHEHTHFFERLWGLQPMWCSCPHSRWVQPPPRSPAPSWHKPSHQPRRLAITTAKAWNSLSCLVLDIKVCNYKGVITLISKNKRNNSNHSIKQLRKLHTG